MKPERPDLQKLNAMTEEGWLTIPNNELQGVKDPFISAAVQRLTIAAREQLCICAISGKVRDLAHKIVGPGLQQRLRTYVQIHIAEVRAKYGEMSAQRILEICNQPPINSDDKKILSVLYREKSWAECKELSTDELSRLVNNGSHIYPQDILITILNGRPSIPGSSALDLWREQK